MTFLAAVLKQMVLPGLQKERGVISWKVQASVGTLGLLYHSGQHSPVCKKTQPYRQLSSFPLVTCFMVTIWRRSCAFSLLQ